MKYLKYGSIILTALVSVKSFAGLNGKDPLTETAERASTSTGRRSPVTVVTVIGQPGKSDDGDALREPVRGAAAADDHDQPERGPLLVEPAGPHDVSPHTAGAAPTSSSTSLNNPPPSYREVDDSNGRTSDGPLSLQAREREDAIESDPRVIAALAELAAAEETLNQAILARQAAENAAAERAAAAVQNAAVEDRVQQIQDQALALRLQAEEEKARKAIIEAEMNVNAQREAVRVESHQGNAHDETKYSKNSVEGAGQRVSDAVFGGKSEAVRSFVTEAGQDLRGSARDIARGVRDGLRNIKEKLSF